MTIHPHASGPYVLLADVPPPDWALLLAWLTGTEDPVGVRGTVALREFLRFKAEKKKLGPAAPSEQA
jgi:hypothetical protein